MKKLFYAMLCCLMVVSLSACSPSVTAAPSSSETDSASFVGPSEPASESEPSAVSESSAGLESSAEPESSAKPAASPDAATQTPAAELPEQERTSRQISVRFGENTVVYELNDGTAADSLCAQLPLTIAVEDYSTNEKIFYPPQALDTSDAPLAQAGAGTLAYYEPWGDVVFFYGDYSENPSLFELGQVISGGELVREMSGTITIELVEEQEGET